MKPAWLVEIWPSYGIKTAERRGTLIWELCTIWREKCLNIHQFYRLCLDGKCEVPICYHRHFRFSIFVYKSCVQKWAPAFLSKIYRNLALGDNAQSVSSNSFRTISTITKESLQRTNEKYQGSITLDKCANWCISPNCLKTSDGLLRAR